MQKSEREVTDENWMDDLLKRGKFIMISLCRDNEPYIVTLSYGYNEGKMYFHTANKGLKLDMIRDNPRVCGTVIEDMGYIHNECSHRYRSVVLEGTMRIVEDLKEKMHGMEVLMVHLENDPEALKQRFLKNGSAYDRITVLELLITSMKGKESS